MNNYNNLIIDKLPNHLRQYIVPQHYHHYTPIDHAVWRYVMRQNYNYLKDVAYYPYIPGLKKAGLSIERVPDLQSMNDALKQIGWGAVTVNGFIPSQAFMEFQAYRVLIIAADIRQLEHIEYTPAPDIIHESAGHAPIIGEPDYAEYLQFTGEVGSKAMSSKKDHELFEAIRKLAVLKELAETDVNEIKQAEEELSYIQNNMGEPSEMALLARLHWWTVEYGLIGNLDDYKIYGAGLLSSIGESVSCMKPDVKKIIYTIDAVNYAYDITKPQPQLFVTPNFQNLVSVLDEFANTLSYRKGGTASLQKAVDSGLPCTVVCSSGLQVSGIFIGDADLNYLKTKGATALAFEGKELFDHGKTFYQEGFLSPIGLLKDYDTPLENFSLNDLKEIGIETGKSAIVKFRNGIEVNGVVENILLQNDTVLLIQFSNGEMKNINTNKILFDFKESIFNMAVGATIISVFAGAADKDAFEQKAHIPEEMPVSNYSSERVKLHELYQQVRSIREGKQEVDALPTSWETLQNNHNGDWLCSLEILEILRDRNIYTMLQKNIETYLHQLKTNKPELKNLIDDGLKTLEQITILPSK